MPNKPAIWDWQGIFLRTNYSEELAEPWPALSDEEVKKYNESINEEFDSLIFRLPNPVICKSSDINSVMKVSFDGRQIRVYPPFKLNNLEEKEGAFEKVSRPEGSRKLNFYRSVPESLPKAVCIDPVLKEGGFYCQGLRLDVTKGTQPHLFIRCFLDLVCQYTHQWWLRSGTDKLSASGR